MNDILVPAGYGEAEFAEKRSRFIGRVWPVDSEDTALALIKETREKFSDASHNVYAYVIRVGDVSRYSDDGEPGGSSGLPAMNVLLGEGVSDALCIVTRYFGGVLLGRGGLSRAYSKAVKLALGSAGISKMLLLTRLAICCEYSYYEQARRILESCGAFAESVDFGANAVIDALCPPDAMERLNSALAGLTAGTAAVEVVGECFRVIQNISKENPK